MSTKPHKVWERTGQLALFDDPPVTCVYRSVTIDAAPKPPRIRIPHGKRLSGRDKSAAYESPDGDK